MAENDKHRARIFLHRGDLVQARVAWEAAVKDDRLTGTQRELSNSLGNLGNTYALAGELEKADACYKEVLTIQRGEVSQSKASFISSASPGLFLIQPQCNI